MRQIIIARKDLNMSPGKLAAQVSHASMAFISHKIRKHTNLIDCSVELNESDLKYMASFPIDPQEWHEWWNGVFTKTVCEAKNFNQLMKAKTIAEELGLREGIDFFLIWDACLTELTPEIVDENGVGRTLTCIGFRPLEDETAWKISKKFQLYK